MAALAFCAAGLAWLLAAQRLSRVICGELRYNTLTWATLCFWLTFAGVTVSVAVSGRLTETTAGGIYGGLAAGIGAAAWARRHWSVRGPTPFGWVPFIQVSATFVLFILLYGKLVTMYQLFDEWGLLGHKAIIEQMGQGVFPPRWPFMPEQPARYHYGVDVWVGAARYAFGGVPGRTTDAWTDLRVVLLAVGMGAAAASVVGEVVGRASAWMGSLAVHFGAGLAFFVYAWIPPPDPYCFVQYGCSPIMVPSQFANFWQHPVSVGAPLWLVGTLLCKAVWTSSPSRVAPAVLAAGLAWAGAAVSQVVFFGLGALSVLSALPFLPERRWGRAATLVGLFGGALVLAVAAGGMFTPTDTVEKGLFVLRSDLGYPPKLSVPEVLFYLVANLGLGFVLLPIMVFRALERRELVGLSWVSFGIGGILACQLFDYTRSWDIVKFPSASMFGLSLAYVLFVDVRWIGRPWWRTAGAVGLMGGGVLVASAWLFPWPADHRPYPSGNRVPDPRMTETIEFMWEHLSDGLAFGQENIVRELSIFGGVPVLGFDVDLYYMGVDAQVYGPLKSDVAALNRTLDPEILQRRRIRYLTYSDEELPRLGPLARERITDPRLFRVVKEIPSDLPGRPDRRRRIYEFVGTDRAASIGESRGADL